MWLKRLFWVKRQCEPILHYFYHNTCRGQRWGTGWIQDVQPGTRPSNETNSIWIYIIHFVGRVLSAFTMISEKTNFIWSVFTVYTLKTVFPYISLCLSRFFFLPNTKSLFQSLFILSACPSTTSQRLSFMVPIMDLVTFVSPLFISFSLSRSGLV